MLKCVFEERNNRPTSSEFIATKIDDLNVYELSDVFDGRSDSIKLAVCQYLDEYVPDNLIYL